MKCRFVVDVDVNPESMSAMERDKVALRDVKHVSGRIMQSPYFPAGTEYEHENAAFFVRQGMADPADSECEKACGMSVEDRERTQHAFMRQSLGIQPDDWRNFDAGYMAGYNDEKPRIDVLGNKSNTWIPGGKFAEYVSLLEAAEKDEDDE